MVEYEVVPLTSITPRLVLDAMNEAFGRSNSLDWYRWKHLDGPWGPSRGWVAVEREAVVGTRLLVPWAFRAGATTHVGARAMDGAVVPRARRRGVFSQLIREEMQALRESAWQTLVSTSVPASRDAYRAIGWTILPPTSMRYRLYRPSLARVVLTSACPELPDAEEDSRLRTAWTTATLTWRADPRSGRSFTFSRLVSADATHGLLFRMVRVQGLRALAVEHCWGRPGTQQQLVRATATALRCTLVLEPDGAATRSVLTGPGWSRSGSTISLWSNDGPGGPRLEWRRPESWAFDQADLEGVL